MSQDDLYDDDFEAPKKKRGLPKWLLGCSCGCTILIIALSVVAIFAVREMTDTEKQWPALKQSLHFEERPAELDMMMGFSVPFSGQKQYSLQEKDGKYTVTVYLFNSGEEVDALFKTEGSGAERLAIPDHAELGERDVQGRSVRELTDTGLSFLPESLVGPGIRIDLSTEDLHRVVELRVNEGKEPLSDEDIQAFLDLFDVWYE